MKIRMLIGLATLVSLGLASSSSAQIITTWMPLQRQAQGGGAATGAQTGGVTFHVMGGYTNWTFTSITDSRAADSFGNDTTGTTTGGRHGFIGAADVAFRVSNNMSVGAGGWVNKVGDVVIDVPFYTPTVGYTATQTIGIYSVYGNAFYKYIGVQAGLVPVRGGNNTHATNGFTNNWSLDQNDMDVFAVGRFSSSRSAQRQWSAMGGAGLYRYGARAGLPAPFSIEGSPAANALTAFANGSVGIVKGLSVDFSLWFTGHDENYIPGSGGISRGGSWRGNSSQTRLTVGVGYGK